MKRVKDLTKTIGMIRYADHYHPSNDASDKKWEALLCAVFPHGKVHAFRQTLPRRMRPEFTAFARRHGYEILFFEKGLGR